MKQYDFAIIGGGPTGYSAVMYAGRLGLKTIIFAGGTPGGLIITTETVENYPGFKSINGFDLFEKIREHAKEYKIEERMSNVVEVRQTEQFIIKTKKEELQAKSILFATGSEYRKLPLPEAENFETKGIHYCALCDGFAYKNKTVAVVGGGDGAAKEVLELAQHAKKVYMIIRGQELKAEAVNQKRIKKSKKIQVLLETQIKKILGQDKIEAIKVGNERVIKLDGIFVAIGHIPRSELAAKLGVKLDERQQIIIDRYTQTNIPGVFAAGDVTDTEFKQLITGAAEGVIAAYKAFDHVTCNI